MKDTSFFSQLCRWTSTEPADVREIVSASAGMLVPLWLAAANGKLDAGLVAAVGSLLVSGIRLEPSLKAQSRHTIMTFLFVALMAATAYMMAGHGALSDVLVIAVIAGIAVIGGYSLDFAIATTRMIFFLLMLFHIVSESTSPVPAILLMLAGAVWTLAAQSICIALLPTPVKIQAAAPIRAAVTQQQRWRRFKKILKELSGWQYALRLSIALCVALLCQTIWPTHHLYWIALTIVILTPRQPDTNLILAAQRTIGTVLGVFVAGLFLVSQPGIPEIVLLVGLFAGLRPYLKTRNYLAYSTIMTPLVMLLIDGSRPLEIHMLADRLIATFAGAMLILLVSRGVRQLE